MSIASKKTRVLVLDGDMVPSLIVARSLAKRNCIIDAASALHSSITRRSNTVVSFYVYPDPLAEEANFLQWLAQHTTANHYDLVIPVTERTLVAIAHHRGMFSHVRVAMPAQDSLEVALDKAQTVELASRVGVPVPGGVTVQKIEQIDEYLPTLKYPVVLKPARSVGSSKGSSSQLQVSYAFDEIELRAGCEHALQFGPILLQEYFSGRGVGIELIAANGKIEYAFQHLRLHEVPLSGGGSSLRKSESIEPVLLEASEKLIAELKWNGVAMVEFKWNSLTREFTLMEINGRFWGSLPLADAAGADFPSMLLDLEVHGGITDTKAYKPNVYCRKLASDLQWYEAVLRRGPESRMADIPGGWEIAKELALVFSPRHYFDVQSIRDPVPGFIDIGNIAATYVRRFSALLEESYFLYQQKRAWRKGRVAKALLNADSVLFMCYGNINRSALADQLSRGYLEDSGLRVMSAGFHQHDGRPADPVMIDIARDNNIDLRGQRSATITEEMLAEHDVIFIMDRDHYNRIGAISPVALEKTWLLGAHGGVSRVNPEIMDPYGQSRGEYASCYRRIDLAISHIKGIMTHRLSL